MNILKRAGLPVTVLAVALALPTLAQAQDPPRSVVSIYHVAPGKQMDFLRWMAARDAIDMEAGIAPTQFYVHVSGDSWDYVAISPDVDDDAINDRWDELARQRGLKVGPAAGMEFRTMMGSHTDTEAVGPMTASELLSGM